MTAWARYSSSPTHTRLGEESRSTWVTLAVRNSVPNRAAWARMVDISSGPWIPCSKPGQFSTSVVSISCPPGWSPVEEISPSMISGVRLARAV